MKRSILVICSSAVVIAGGYKIPEQSLEGMALSAARIAHGTGADTAYYNPANMAFLVPQLHFLETDLTFVTLPKIDYDGMQIFPPATIVPADAKSEKEFAVFPTFHYVDRAHGKWRWGVSLTAPVGQTHRWHSPIQGAFAQKFYLMTAELNPSLSYRLSDTLAIAAGLRLVYSEGEVDSDANAIGVPIKRQMKGDTVEAGYNLALAWHPGNGWELGITYRSKIDLAEKGTANLYLGGAGNRYSARVTVPMPAALDIGIAKSFDNWTVELDYERTFWSSYKTLDFRYDTPIPPALVPYFDDPKPKNWRDTNTYRLGITYRYSDRLTLMGGLAYDETPVPAHSLSYELPDADAWIVSAGFRWKQNDHLHWGVALLYDHKKKRTITLQDRNEYGIDGTFKHEQAILVTAGFEYTF